MLVFTDYSVSTGATRAKQCLNGFEMYFGGSNKLYVEFAWTTPPLYVAVNDLNKSWDYTMNICGTQQQPVLAQQQSTWYYDANYQQYAPSYQNYVAPIQCYNSNVSMVPTQPLQQQQQQKFQNHNTQQPMLVFSPSVIFQPNVMYITGLNSETSNPDKLFNLLSLYGNVATIQFLPSRQGSAFVQMFDTQSVDYCVQYLNNIPIGICGRLQVSWANPNYFPSRLNQFKLVDGSANFKDFTESKNQRFLVPRPSFWIQPPSRVVRYYNTPSSLSEENIMDILNKKPRQVRALKMPADEKSHMSRGLLEFDNTAQAILAVMKFNNKEIRTSSKSVHFMKLCFSSSQSLDLKN
jgi:hnRNP-L/PTB/hephaestus splicing factor